MTEYPFNVAARQLLDAATLDARRRQHEYIGTEHILSAMLDNPGGPAASILTALRIDFQELRQQLDSIVTNGDATDPGMVLPYTSRTKQALEFAIQEARASHAPDIGAEHLLMGLLAEGRGIGAQLLIHSGVTIPAVRDLWTR